ncbi:MAG: hypothetical protein WAO08_33860 [Hyphomicrobiaceae bacterium]
MPNGQRLLIAIFAIVWALASASILLEGAADGRFRAILDKPWPQAGCGMASIAAIVCAGPAMLMLIFNFLSMVANVRPEKRMLVHFVAPIAIFLPQFWTKPGNRYRRLALLWTAIFGLLATIPLTCTSFVK